MAPSTPNRCTAVCALAGHTIQQGRTTRGIAEDAANRLRSARGWTLRLAACPQELPLLWTHRLVRTDCRPDMHLDRPPVAPAFVALVPRLPDVPSVIRVLQARHRSGHRHPLHDMKTLMRRPLPERDGGKIFLSIAKVNSPRRGIKRY